MQYTITDDLDVLFDALPLRITAILRRHPQRDQLIEIVMDLGRMPEGRFPDGEVILDQEPITADDIAYVTARVGEFGDDNRAGLERTLHRISAIRNRHGTIIGLTCRVGRAVSGTVALIRDVIEEGRSMLILGRPGVGKTTMLREVARVLADELDKRVVIVDTSNEIAGDGDIPHSGIGRARRMQVARTSQQHAVMIEAVENHMPEVIIIDEIGTELEAQAARTIAERGVQLVGTAHGNTLDNLLLNPTLSDLVGGIGSVTLGDEEARRRGTQKTVLERKAPPTFDVVIEQQERTKILIHANVANTVDALLRGECPTAEARQLNGDGKLQHVQLSFTSQRPELAAQAHGSHERGRRVDHHISALHTELPPIVPEGRLILLSDGHDRNAFVVNGHGAIENEKGRPLAGPRQPDGILRVYSAGFDQERVAEVAQEFECPLLLVNAQDEADVLLMHRNRYLRRDTSELDALQRPLLVLASRSRDTLRKAFSQITGIPAANHTDEERAESSRNSASVMTLPHPSNRHKPSRVVRTMVQEGGGQRYPEAMRALQEAEDAINYILRGSGNGIELSPQRASIRRMQHLLAERYNVTSRSYGKEPNRRVCIFSA
jgi:stage III sporulation protein SpoIIIAA